VKNFTEKKFLADGMLGKLTRFMRILGFDTLYLKDANDDELLLTAQKDNRILITRDQELYKRAIKMGIISILITEVDIEKQLSQMMVKLNINLDLDILETRCPICNTKLEQISKNKIKELIPEKVFKAHEDFWICPKCNKIYWMGSHWKSINRTLSNAKQKAINLFNSSRN
jgi:uncharacterized protein with PIN domain